jgi:hypothetical protein
MNKFGVYSISTIANSRAANWSPNKNRFVDENQYKKGIPGPGEYNPSDYSGSFGYILSTNKNMGSVKIKLDSYRKSSRLTATPGPGSYVPPSDFGYLEMYKNHPKTSQSRNRRGSIQGESDRNDSMIGQYPPKFKIKRTTT